MEKARVLKSFIEMLEERTNFRFNVDDFKSRLMLQKYVFIAERFRLNLGYDYSLYIRGPYSRDLAEDYYHLPDRGEGLPHTFRISEFLSLVSDADSDWLEVAATLIMVWEHTRDLEWALERTSELKYWIPKEKIEKIAERLMKFGLIKGQTKVMAS